MLERPAPRWIWPSKAIDDALAQWKCYVGCVAGIQGALFRDEGGAEVVWRGSSVATAQGVANLVGGLWPLVHVRSFEAVFGPKVDRWLVKTVSGLLVVDGLTQLSCRRSVEAVAVARRLGIGTAAVLAAIDLVYVPMRRISPMYLLDAAAELGWIVAWSTADRAG